MLRGNDRHRAAGASFDHSLLRVQGSQSRVTVSDCREAHILPLPWDMACTKPGYASSNELNSSLEIESGETLCPGDGMVEAADVESVSVQATMALYVGVGHSGRLCPSRIRHYDHLCLIYSV